MAIFNLEYINEAYKSKYASYFDNDDMDDDEDDDEDEDDEKESTSDKVNNTKSSSNNKEKKEDTKLISKPLTHISSRDLYRIIEIAKATVNRFPRLKKCFDYVDISDKCEYDDDGRRVSAIDLYHQKGATSYIKLIEGDVWSGYPDFKDGGSDTYEEDSKAFVKTMNERLSSMGMMVKFASAHDSNDEAISFGVRSYDINKKKKEDD